jgi:hypothetical protein
VSGKVPSFTVSNEKQKRKEKPSSLAQKIPSAENTNPHI